MRVFTLEVTHRSDLRKGGVRKCWRWNAVAAKASMRDACAPVDPRLADRHRKVPVIFVHLRRVNEAPALREICLGGGDERGALGACAAARAKSDRRHFVAASDRDRGLAFWWWWRWRWRRC
eukprot:188230-Prymnesium_polylepis.1